MNTITVKYWGRTGNVLFQISAAIAYSNKTNRPFILSKYDLFPNLENYSASSIGLNEDEYVESLKEIKEEDISPEFSFPENQNIRLFGFFQNYKLFDEYKDQVLDVIGFPAIRSSVLPKLDLPTFKSRGLFQTPPNSNEVTVSLHIRRGDYEELSCYFLLLNEYYYRLALLHIANQLRGKKIKVIFFYEKTAAESSKRVINALLSDNDLAQYSIEYYHFNDLLEESSTAITDIEEMAVMSHCNHHIIANSTFSWWSAYINPDPNKIVCYPNEYFNHQLWYLNNDGLKVDEWTSIEAWNPYEYRCACR